jgi:hypothetical protein
MNIPNLAQRKMKLELELIRMAPATRVRVLHKKLKGYPQPCCRSLAQPEIFQLLYFVFGP